MPKKSKRLTRADKLKLSNLSDQFESPNDLGVPLQTLENLERHGLTQSLLENGDIKFKITEKGAKSIPENKL